MPIERKKELLTILSEAPLSLHMVRPRGIEPPLPDPESGALSTELRAYASKYTQRQTTWQASLQA